VGIPSESANKNVKKPTPTPPSSHTIGPVEPYGVFGQTNHTTIECRVETNKCYGVVEHNILLLPNVGEATPLPPRRKGPASSLRQ